METQSIGPQGYVKSVLDRVRASGMNDSEVCRKAGIAPSTFVRIKSGKHSPTVSTLDKIESVLDLEAEMKRAGESSA